MAQLNIGGQSVLVDDSFLNLPADKQQATVDEISQSLSPKQPFPAGAPGPGLLAGVKEAAPAVANMGYRNVMLGAEQGTSPNLDLYRDPIAKNAQVTDSGEAYYTNEKGQTVPTDKSKHVVLYGPDNNLNVYERRPNTDENRMVGLARVMTMGMGTGALQTAPYTATEASVPALREAATAVYDDPAILGRTVNRADLVKGLTDLRPQLKNFDEKIIEKQIRPQLDITPRGAGNNYTVGDLETASRRLGNIIARPPSNAPGADRAAVIVKQKIDELIRNVAPEFVSADANYTAAKTTESLTGRANVARVRGLGSNAFADRMSTQAKQLLLKPEELRRLTPDEIGQVEQMAEGGFRGGSLRALGIKAPAVAGGVLGAPAGAALGGAFGPAGAAMGTTVGGLVGGGVGGVIGGILTRIGNRMTANQVNALSQAVRARSPLGQEIARNVDAWEIAAQRAQGPATAAAGQLPALARASRDLARSLQNAGVDVSPGQLMPAPAEQQ